MGPVYQIDEIKKLKKSTKSHYMVSKLVEFLTSKFWSLLMSTQIADGQEVIVAYFN